MLTSKTFKGVLWDIDDTLILSECLHDESVFGTLDSMGFEDYEDKINALGMGNSLDTIWAVVGGAPEKQAEFEKRVTRYYIENVGTLQPRSCAVDLVKTLNKAGIVQAAVSNGKKCIVDANLEHLGIRDMMKAVITRDDCINGKPDAEPYLIAADRVGLSAKDCIVVEDSPVGAQSGKVAGALSIFWPENADMESEYCDYKISDILDVPWKEILGIDIES